MGTGGREQKSEGSTMCTDPEDWSSHGLPSEEPKCYGSVPLPLHSNYYIRIFHAGSQETQVPDDLTLGTPERPEAQSGLAVRPAGKVQCQGGRTKPYRPHLHWSKLHLWGNTISRLLGFQTHTQDMHQSLFCICSLSTNLGSCENSNIMKGDFSFQFHLTGKLANSLQQCLTALSLFVRAFEPLKKILLYIAITLLT